MNRLLALSTLLWLALAGPALAEGMATERTAGEGTTYEAAERAYRADELEQAERILRALLAQDPSDHDAKLLLGFVRYRQGDDRGAYRLFHDLLPQLPEVADLFYGLALSSRGLGRPAEAARYARWARRLEPEREDLSQFLRSLVMTEDGQVETGQVETGQVGTSSAQNKLAENDPRPSSAQALRLPFRAEGGQFRLENGASLTVKGVNLGMALPGRFATEFPEERGFYDRWLRLIAAMNANTVRLYTVAPPVFYRALRDYNLAHPGAPLYLIQGVWTEPPEGDDYHGPFKATFLGEAYRALDLLHGQAVVEARPDQASGAYEADVSPWLLGLILGREWEPASVSSFNARPDAPRRYEGRFLRVGESSAMEAWLAEVMDRVSLYHFEHFKQQTPIAFVNWLTIAPRDGPAADGAPPGAQPDEQGAFLYGADATVVDAATITPTAAFLAGHFASYHAFPYYPDYLSLDPDYSRHPRSNYMAHLERLGAHHGDQAVLISEFGVPSSRGQSRSQPQGYHQGGNDEAAQAEIIAKLYSEVIDSGMAGGVVFAWLDEWFKRHWLYDALERPSDHLPRWHSVMNPEQNYGLVGFAVPGEPPLGSDPADWQEAQLVAEGNGVALYAQASPSYLHLLVKRLEVAGSEVTGSEGRIAPFERVTLTLDTHPASGPEFYARLTPEEGSFWVNAGYQPYKAAETGAYGFDWGARPESGAGWARWMAPSYEDGAGSLGGLDEPGRLRPGRCSWSPTPARATSSTAPAPATSWR